MAKRARGLQNRPISEEGHYSRLPHTKHPRDDEEEKRMQGWVWIFIIRLAGYVSY